MNGWNLDIPRLPIDRSLSILLYRGLPSLGSNGAHQKRTETREMSSTAAARFLIPMVTMRDTQPILQYQTAPAVEETITEDV